MSVWRQMPWRSQSSSVAEWKSSCLGRHSRLSFGGLLCSLGCQRSKISIAELAATKKEEYSGLAADYLFQPIAVEILGPINESASDFLSLLAKKKSANILATSERLHFCSSVFPRSCSDITAFCCTIPLFGRTTRGVTVTPTIFYFLSRFFQNPSGS